MFDAERALKDGGFESGGYCFRYLYPKRGVRVLTEEHIRARVDNTEANVQMLVRTENPDNPLTVSCTWADLDECIDEMQDEFGSGQGEAYDPTGVLVRTLGGEQSQCPLNLPHLNR